MRTPRFLSPSSTVVLGCLTAVATVFACGQVRALTVTAVTSDNGYPAHKVQWTDAVGLPRSAVLVDQNSNGTGPFTGFLRQYTYQLNGQTRICTGTDNFAAGGVLEFSGDGFVQNHTADGGDFSSGNGAGVRGTTTITLQGSSHAIITFNMPNYVISKQVVPTTVQWFFADGRSHPVFAVSQDARNTAGNLGSDTRSPYGDMAYDGDGIDALVGGFSYGDTYKFVTLAADPEEVTAQSGWRATEANTIPYAMQWAEPATVDAEMGHVATLPISLSDQGGDTQTSNYVTPPDLFDPRTKNEPAGPLPAANTYAYQIINYSLAASGPTDSKRLAWGSNFGRVGGFDNYGDTSLNVTQYSQHSTDPINQPLAGTRADGLLMAYSTFIVLGPHLGSYLNGTVGQTVTQMETVAGASLTAAVGSVVASGPAGVGAAANATISYTPAGYNPTYATWEINAAQNAVNATLTPPSGTSLDHPVFVIDGFTAAQLSETISINGQSRPGVDYFATLDTASQRLWITVNQVASSAINLIVATPIASVPQITSFSPASGAVGSTVFIKGTGFVAPLSVIFGGNKLAVHGFNATQINAQVPAGAITGPIKVNANGGNASTASNFIVTFPPTITSFSPASGAVGSTVVIKGTGFVAPLSVIFGGNVAAVHGFNATQINATVPAGAVTGPIKVNTSGGSVSTASSFTVPVGPPTISSFSPAGGAVGSTVTIRGTGFVAPLSVIFAGNVAAVHGFTSTVINATVPSGAQTGPIKVNTNNGSASTASSFMVGTD